MFCNSCNNNSTLWLIILIIILFGWNGNGNGCGCGCGCGCEDDEEDVIIAKIVKGADGEDEYVEPTDDEFEAVQKAYDALVEESEQE